MRYASLACQQKGLLLVKHERRDTDRIIFHRHRSTSRPRSRRRLHRRRLLALLVNVTVAFDVSLAFFFCVALALAPFDDESPSDLAQHILSHCKLITSGSPLDSPHLPHHPRHNLLSFLFQLANDRPKSVVVILIAPAMDDVGVIILGRLKIKI
jgi:hypothetical protein